MAYNVTQLLVKPTYDISNYGEDLTLNPRFIIDKNNSGIALSIKLN